jgi:predicted secreted protein
LAPPDELALRLGEEVVLPLLGAGSVGYVWTWQVEGEADAIAISIEAQPSAPLPTHDSGPIGGSFDQRLRIKALREGRATVTLTLSRPFQPAHPPRSRHVMNVTVQSGGP